MRAVYLSALVFPGLGQFYLKNYIRGILFSVVAGIGFIIIMEATWSVMMLIANDIENGRQRLDINSLTLVIKESIKVFEEPTIMAAKIIFMAIWIISSVDAYLTIKHHSKSSTK